MFFTLPERKKAEEALSESKDFAENLIETANVMVLGLDLEGKIIIFNSAAEKITGYSKEEVLGNSYETILPRELYGYVWEEFERLLHGGLPKTYENPILTKSGKERHIAWQNNEIYKDGQIVGTISFGIDNTKRKKAEKKLNRTIDELKRSNEELERFAYVSSHDLQEPLRMVTLYSQLLERRYKDSLDSDADDFIEYIVDNAKRMKHLIDDLLEYSRVTSQAKEFENVDLEKVLDVVLTNLSVFISENNVKVIHESLPIVFADQNQMLQVFQNLIYQCH